MIDRSKRVNAFKNKSWYIVKDIRTDTTKIIQGVTINGNRSRYIPLSNDFLNKALAEKFLNNIIYE